MDLWSPGQSRISGRPQRESSISYISPSRSLALLCWDLRGPAKFNYRLLSIWTEMWCIVLICILLHVGGGLLDVVSRSPIFCTCRVAMTRQCTMNNVRNSRVRAWMAVGDRGVDWFGCRDTCLTHPRKDLGKRQKESSTWRARGNENSSHAHIERTPLFGL